MRQIFSLAVLTLALAAGAALAADSPVGTWKTVDEKSGKVESTVEVYEQGGKLFGRITGLAEPNDAQGKPKTCSKCTGADKGQPMVGLVIIKGLSASDGHYKGGTIMDPRDGKIYKAELWVEDGKLRVRGYLGLFYKTRTWLKGS